MANVSRMSTTEAREAAPAPVCLFFDVLPSEIRLLIYEMAFHGSRVHATLSLNEEPPSGRYPLRFRHSVHFNLLLSCRRIYDEALPTYWSEAVLSLKQPEKSTLELAKALWGVRLAPDSYSYHLCSSLPDVAKMNIKHIRNMMLPPLDGDFVEKNPQLTAAALLSNFKSLATCEIDPTFYHHPGVFNDIRCYTTDYTEAYSESDTDTETNTDTGSDLIEPCFIFGRFTMLWDNWPEDIVVNSSSKYFPFSRLGIDAAAEVVFLRKTEDSIGLECNVKYVPLRGDQTRTQFWNLLKGVFYESYPHKVDDEYGYKMAMRPESRPID